MMLFVFVKNKEEKSMKKRQLVLALASTLVTCGLISNDLWASQIELADKYRDFGLISKAKESYIAIAYSDSNSVFGGSSAGDVARALYSLGAIAFDEDRIELALESWTELTTKYPDSTEASLVKASLADLAQVSNQAAKGTIENALAASYIDHGDFWSDDRRKTFLIDASWMDKVDAAISWYDKVWQEYPGTKASKIALEHKMQTLLGWKDSGQYGSSYGVRRSFSTYMPRLLEAFAEYETQFPESGSLQAFRYQVAQSYWNQKDWKNTRDWLNRIVAAAGASETFYSTTAKLRLLKVEY